MILKTTIVALFIIFALPKLSFSDDVTTVTAADSISENLDLNAVASIFGESKDLEDFEKRLNDPEAKISNLDLNGDGEVDYIRVIEASKDETHAVTLQAVIGKDLYQDVAVIDVEKDKSGETSVQVVGDVAIYGPTYIVEPVYVHPPVIIVWFWGPYYNPWRSPYYYGYYPPYYRPWTPYPPHRYRSNVHVHINVNNSYRHTTVRRSHTSVQIQNNNRRNDYYGKRNGASNKTPSQRPNNNNGTRPNQKPSSPATKPSTRPTQKPSTKPATRPAQKPAKSPQPSTKPSTRPANKPSTSPATKPSTRPATKQTRPTTRPSTPTRKPASRPSGGRRR